MRRLHVAGSVHAPIALVLLLALVPHRDAGAQQSHDHGASVPVHFPISCSANAQAEFDRAVTLLHHMTYPMARQAFERVASIDPRCAMAHWGVAMTLFQPLWPTRPGPAQLAQGWDAVEKARALAAPTERERLFVAATEAFFIDPASSDYWARIRRWERASAQAFGAMPHDLEAAAFFALSHLATAPADSVTRRHADSAAVLLVRVLEQRPEHPGAMHYLIHANDVPGRERELMDVTRRYDAVAPGNPHALHMPTHIYTRVGDWDAVIAGNVRAAEAALTHPAGPRGDLVWDEFPHAIEYMVYAWLQKGADDSAAAQVQRLRSTERLEPTLKTAFNLASTRARLALERRAWDEAAALVAREPATLDWNRFTWPEAITHFARGMGAVHLKRLDDAARAERRLEELLGATRAAGEALFARNVRLLQLELSAWIAHAEGRRDTAVAMMREATALETSTPKHAVTPAPTLPAHELLGDMLLEQRRASDALAAYRRALELYPGRLNSLLGAARSAREIGDASLARRYYSELLAIAEDGSRDTVLREAREYVGGSR